MRICDLSSSIGQLRRATKELGEKWEQTKEFWDDQASKEFEETYLQPLLPTMTLTMNSVQKLEEILRKAEKDCGEDTFE